MDWTRYFFNLVAIFREQYYFLITLNMNNPLTFSYVCPAGIPVTSTRQLDGPCLPKTMIFHSFHSWRNTTKQFFSSKCQWRTHGVCLLLLLFWSKIKHESCVPATFKTNHSWDPETHIATILKVNQSTKWFTKVEICLGSRMKKSKSQSFSLTKKCLYFVWWKTKPSRIYSSETQLVTNFYRASSDILLLIKQQ